MDDRVLLSKTVFLPGPTGWGGARMIWVGGLPGVTLIGQLWAIIDNAVGVGSEERCELH